MVCENSLNKYMVSLKYSRARVYSFQTTKGYIQLLQNLNWKWNHWNHFALFFFFLISQTLVTTWYNKIKERKDTNKQTNHKNLNGSSDRLKGSSWQTISSWGHSFMDYSTRHQPTSITQHLHWKEWGMGRRWRMVGPCRDGDRHRDREAVKLTKNNPKHSFS